MGLRPPSFEKRQGLLLFESPSSLPSMVTNSTSSLAVTRRDLNRGKNRHLWANPSHASQSSHRPRLHGHDPGLQALPNGPPFASATRAAEHQQLLRGACLMPRSPSRPKGGTGYPLRLALHTDFLLAQVPVSGVRTGDPWRTRGCAHSSTWMP